MTTRLVIIITLTSSSSLALWTNKFFSKHWHSSLLTSIEANKHSSLVIQNATVKNLLGLQDVYVQVFMTRLTPVIRIWHFLKSTFSDQNRRTAFHSFINKKSCFDFMKLMMVTLIYFAHGYQLTIFAN